MKRHLWFIGAGLLLALLAGGAILARFRTGLPANGCERVSRAPGLRPEYVGCVIPPNIAPLNFLVEEPGTRYGVEIRSAQGKPITVISDSPAIVIPVRPWRNLLRANLGEDLLWDVYVRDSGGKWTRFDTIRNTIANEDIDDFLVYRKIRPLYNFWTDVGVFQRDLTGYEETPVLHNKQVPSDYSGSPCINCHAFCNNRTDRMTIGIRSATLGSSTPMALNGTVTKLGTKFGYTSWHPSGEIVAYALNEVRQFFHGGGTEVRDVVDLDSDLGYYRIGSKEVKTSPGISHPDRMETYPTWSPDGRFLYFCSAPILWSDRDAMPPEHYEDVRYDLMRASYDIKSDTWGEPETVLASGETGLSILLPRISPDGRYLLFCMCKYGCFPIYQPSSDLYLMDLETQKYERLPLNSDQSESWHSWSSNGRWFAFSSKRNDGIFTRTYLSYFDSSGKSHKPVIVPQKSPTFYDSHLKTFSVPELITEPVRVSSGELVQAVCSPRQVKLAMPDISMTRTRPKPSPWRPGPTVERE